jgi:hypothetical protein
MRVLEHKHVQHIERVLERPLTDEELASYDRLENLSATALGVAKKLASESRMLAMMYLQEIVPGTRMGIMKSFLEDVLEGERSISEWASMIASR